MAGARAAEAAGMSGLRASPAVAVVEEGDTVYAARLPDGPILVLDGVAALVWDAARRNRRREVAHEVAEATGADLAAIRPVIDAFIDDLVDRGLLVADAE
jgi:hypothetical protein